MKKLMVLVMLVGLLWGCAPYHVKIQGHLARITGKDSFVIAVNEEFKYIGDKKYIWGVAGYTFLRVKGYIYAKDINDYVMIAYVDSPVLNIPNVGDACGIDCFAVDSGDFCMNGACYKSYVKVQRNKTYSHKVYMMTRLLALELYKGYWLLATYTEEVDLPGVRFEDWRDPFNLSEEQKKYIEEYNQRFKKVLKIVRRYQDNP
jgi:hypothetical protein